MLLSARKRYLTGSDWVIATLDRMLKSRTGVGNQSQVVFELDGLLDPIELERRVKSFLQRFPAVAGRVRRDLKLAPYWSIPEAIDSGCSFTVHECGVDVSAESVLARAVNTPFLSERDHLAFHLVRAGSRSFFSMVFDHRLFDARGAESFLSLFQKEGNSSAGAGAMQFSSSSGLRSWKKKFLAGRNVNRRIMALSRNARPIGLSSDKAGEQYCYRVLTFSEQETARIIEQAYREAGYLLESPYLLAIIIETVHELLQGRGLSGSGYLVPVTMDLRPGRDPLQEIFFNYVSYLFYQISAQPLPSRPQLIATLKEQLYDQVRSGFPRDLAEASMLTRIAPPALLDKLLRLPMKGTMATFAFSHLGRSFYEHREFLGLRIRNLAHMPRVPAQPGIGFFSNVYGGRLNVVLSSLDGLLTDREAERIEQNIRTLLTGATP